MMKSSMTKEEKIEIFIDFYANFFESFAIFVFIFIDRCFLLIGICSLIFNYFEIEKLLRFF